MKNNMITNFDIKNLNNSTNLLEEVIRDGARKMLQAAIENEVIEFVESHKNITNEKGHRVIVRNGYLPHAIFKQELVIFLFNNQELEIKQVALNLQVLYYQNI